MIDWDAKPIEAGQGGDPWRIAVCAVVRYQADQRLARVALRVLLERWPTPLDVLRASPLQLVEVLWDLVLCHRKVRTLRRLARAWLLNERLFNKTVLKAVRRWGDDSRRNA